MAMSTFTCLSYHVVFSTKYRRKQITESLQDRLYHYVGGIERSQNGSLIEMGGIEDHVHLLVNLSPTIAVSDAVRELKANSSKWVNELPETKTRFQWQKGYGAFTVSHSQIAKIQAYIRDQREHHRTRSFQEEFIAFLKRHHVRYDPRYVFETDHYG